MKILIISTPRSGSTALFNGIFKSLNNYKGFCEPSNLQSESLGNPIKDYSLNYPNLIVKILTWDVFYSRPLPLNTIDLLFANNFVSLDNVMPSILEDLVNYSSDFNKVILLRRKNEIESAKSSRHASLESKYHNPYFYNNTKYDYSENLNFIVNHNKIIHNLSNILKIPITYYEDLFQGSKSNINNFLTQNNIQLDNINTFYEYLNPKNRYRQN